MIKFHELDSVQQQVLLEICKLIIPYDAVDKEVEASVEAALIDDEALVSLRKEGSVDPRSYRDQEFPSKPTTLLFSPRCLPQESCNTFISDVYPQIQQSSLMAFLKRFSYELLHHYDSSRNVYLYGPVGRGKTMILGAVFEAFKGSKLRFHFDQLSADLHKHLNQMSLEAYAKHFLYPYKLLWIDELQLYDIASCMLFKKLIPLLINNHNIVMMSGNVDPVNFYKDGINRQQFEDFIPYFISHFKCINLEGEKDYRLINQAFSRNSSLVMSYFLGEADSMVSNTKGSSLSNLMFEGSTPCQSAGDFVQDQVKRTSHQKFLTKTETSQQELYDIFLSKAPLSEPASYLLELKMRTWPLSTTLAGRYVFLDFKDIALESHFFDDYDNLIKNFPHIFVVNVPVFTSMNREECRRFMAFIDILYDYPETSLHLESFANSLSAIYQDHEGALPFERTLSRLTQLLF